MTSRCGRDVAWFLDEGGLLLCSQCLPTAFWLRPVLAVTASVQLESGRIVYPFQFRFSKEGMDLVVQNRPRSDLDGLVRV